MLKQTKEVTKNNAEKVKAETAETKSKRPSYRGPSGFISVEKAKELRWARKSDGMPTKFYEHELERRKAVKEGEVYKRPRKAAPDQTHAGIQSPYDLRRRSGYAEIWKVLAENADTFVSYDELLKTVNERLKIGENSKDWYEEKYTSNDKLYDTHDNAVVINRAPYNERIEALRQRVILDAELGVMLQTNVTEPRQQKRKGRKSNAVAQIQSAEEGTEVPATAVDDDVVANV